MEALFDFEKPIINLEQKLQDLRELAKQEGVDFSGEISMLEKKVTQLIDETCAKLTPWQRVQLSRHPSRPHSRDYIDALFPDFMELQGDRAFGDDQAIVCGIATWPEVADGLSVLILGQQKGRTTKQKMERNFGMARPEGYRKAMRLMQLADRFGLPIVAFIDTPGAYPGADAEERGQSQAIAESIRTLFEVKVPVVAVVIGEGGSGGALALGVANRVLMQEYSTYSVISPESCASILWSDSSLAERAAEKMRMNGPDLLKMGVIDAIIPEPKGGAHRDWPSAFELMKKGLLEQFGPYLTSQAGAAKTSRSSRSGKTKGKSVAGNPALERLEKFASMGELALAHAPSKEDGSPETQTR